MTAFGSTGALTSQALGYTQHGSPALVIQAATYNLKPLEKGQVRIKFLYGALNPADVNVIQGVYPNRPGGREDVIPGSTFSIMGNEGVGIVEGFIGDGVIENCLNVGDMVIMGVQQQGTWQSFANLPFEALIPLPSSNLTPIQAGTIAINPPSAYRMLTDYVNIREASKKTKQWIIQNGANSAVGTAVIQLAKAWGASTINLVRDRRDFGELEKKLVSLGADLVLPFSAFNEDSVLGTRKRIKELVGDGELLLALNCVGGLETTEMTKTLDNNGILVTYGAMAKTPLALPPPLFIFKNLTATGFWLSLWNKTHPLHERIQMFSEITELIHSGKLVQPKTNVIELKGSDEQITEKVRKVFNELEGGIGNLKVLWRLNF